MTYTLGLDLGAASIGWALLTPEKNDTDHIKRLGSRIFPEGLDAKSREPKNAARRNARLIRRQIARRAVRRQTVLKAFQTLNWLPPLPADLDKIWNENPYLLRKKALNEKLSLAELARVFFHLSKHRGFKSNRKTDAADESLPMNESSADESTRDAAAPAASKKSKSSQPKKNKLRDGTDDNKGYGELDNLLRNGEHRTIGEYFASLNPHEVRIRSRYTLRKHYEDEFEKICTAQQAFHYELSKPVPDALLVALCSRKQQALWRKKSGSEKSFRAFIGAYLIFFQRPLKSQKHTVGRCSLEPKSKRAPMSSLAYQTFRIWSTLATIELLTPERRFLTTDEKSRAAAVLETVKDMEVDTLLLKINLTTQGKSAEPPRKIRKEELTTNYKDKKIKGNDTAVQLATMFAPDDVKKKKSDTDVFALWNALSDTEQEYRWKIIYDADDNEWLIKFGKEKWQLSDAGAENLTKIHFTQGYGNLSQTAIKKLIPYFKNGLNYAEACIASGYHHSDKRPAHLSSKLSPPPNLRNPIVQQGLFELRRLMNAVIAEHGLPAEIHIEFARELKLPKQKRDALTADNADREKVNKGIIAELRKGGIANPSGEDIRKYQLWQECGQVCPYTGDNISFEQLFRTGQVQIEHILPYSRTQDDSFNNTTLCFENFNRRKNNRSPFEMFDQSSLSQAEYDLIVGRVKAFGNPMKLRRFTQKEIDTDKFVSRQLNDTAYLSVEAKKYLETICSRVFATNGQATAKLRKLWGLNSLLHPLNKRAADATLEEKEAVAEKNRNDSRHHALDAVVIAATTPADIKRLSAYSQYNREARAERFPLPWETFREDLKEKLDDVLVSRYQKNKTTGALHEATFYGAVRAVDGSHQEGDKAGEKIYTIRKPVSDLTGKMVTQIGDAAIRNLFMAELKKLRGGEGQDNKLPKDFYEAIKKLRVPTKKVTLNGNRTDARSLTPKDVSGITPPFIRALFEQRLSDFPNLSENDTLPEAFFEHFGLPIKHVRIHQPSTVRKELRTGVFIETGSNHHIELFKVIDGAKRTGKRAAGYAGRIVTLFDAAARKREGKPVVDKIWDGHEFVMSLMIDEMILLSEDGFDASKIDWSNPDYRSLSQHLYRVQKMTGNNISFCFHRDSTLENSFAKTPNTLKGIKVKVDILGNIKPISSPTV